MIKTDRQRDIPARQTFLAQLATLVLLFAGLLAPNASAQLHDALEAYPPRWSLDTSDCDARVIDHKHLPAGGIDGRGCENIVFISRHGSQAVFAYPIEPVEVNDELTANLSVMSAKSGPRIGFRVRFPYARDEESGKAIAVSVYGADYDDPGQFASIGIGSIRRQVGLKKIAIRRELGSTTDLRDPYVDAIIVNAYTGPGTTALRLDELSVTGMIPIGDSVRTSDGRDKDGPTRLLRRGPDGQPLMVEAEPGERSVAFPVNRVTRILQHNGEPLAWVRSLGFDAVLLSKPPNAEILREAIRSQILIYAPPPSAPQPELQPLLEPVAAWYLGSKRAMDEQQLNEAARISRLVHKFPKRWQRPLIAAPAERFDRYAPLVDALIDDLPIRDRGILPAEEAAEIAEVRRQSGHRLQYALGVSTLPPQVSMNQSLAISRAIGAPGPSVLQWHSMWAQIMRTLESTPNAILFRSTQSLTSGTELDTQRAAALSYINRMVAMIEPWLVEGEPRTAPALVGAAYRCGRVAVGDTELFIITSRAARGDEILAGDGDSLDILLSPNDAGKIAYRLTHFSAERLVPKSTELGPRIQIVSPDVVELIAISADARLGSRVSQSAKRFVRRATSDRLQLAGDFLTKTRQHWNLAVNARATTATAPTDLLSAAARTMDDAQSAFRAGDLGNSLRLARRSDAWALRGRWKLSEALMPDWPNPTSCPTLISSAIEAQIAWHPLMKEQGWALNSLVTGALDTPDVFGEGRWAIGKRMQDRAQSDVSMVSRGAFNGKGAIRATVTPRSDNPLPGGYEGTAIQIRSPAIRVPAGKAFRVDAMIRTIGFGGPHQGLLVYDTIGGQELGVLVRGRPDWTSVRLYRHATVETNVSVMFEVIGGGEATIDEVALQLWDPKPSPYLPFRPITEISQQTSDSPKR